MQQSKSNFSNFTFDQDTFTVHFIHHKLATATQEKIPQLLLQTIRGSVL